MTKQAMPPSIDGWVAISPSTLGEVAPDSRVILQMNGEWRLATAVGHTFSGASTRDRPYRRIRRHDLPQGFATNSQAPATTVCWLAVQPKMKAQSPPRDANPEDAASAPGVQIPRRPEPPMPEGRGGSWRPSTGRGAAPALTPVQPGAREWWTIVVVRAGGEPETLAFEDRQTAVRWGLTGVDPDRPVMRLLTRQEPETIEGGLRRFRRSRMAWTKERRAEGGAHLHRRARKGAA